MKKLILLIIPIILLSCSKEDDVCKCKGKFSQNPADGTFFYNQNTEIDCDTRQLIKPLDSNPNALFWGCVD